jgi:hypothetical protein
MLKSALARRFGVPAIFLAGAVTGLGAAALGQQTHMQNALNALNTAKAELQAADRDKGGHRSNAIKFVNSAISEVNAGINYSAAR